MPLLMIKVLMIRKLMTLLVSKNCLSENRWMIGSVDPGQLSHSVVSNLGTHCLLGLVCNNAVVCTKCSDAFTFLPYLH